MNLKKKSNRVFQVKKKIYGNIEKIQINKLVIW